MSKQGTFIGLIGAPAVGKGYIMRGLREKFGNLESLLKVTTREPRELDAQEGVVAVTYEQFASLESNLIAIHTPFENGNRYGWYVGGVLERIRNGTNYIADPNIRFLDEFQNAFRENIHLVGITADYEYIAYNLHLRNGNVMDEKTKKDSEMRLLKGLEYSQEIISAYGQNKIHTLINLDWSKRENAVELVLQSLPEHTLLSCGSAPESQVRTFPESIFATHTQGTERR